MSLVYFREIFECSIFFLNLVSFVNIKSEFRELNFRVLVLPCVTELAQFYCASNTNPLYSPSPI